MMHPMRVEWTVPDETKQAAANVAMQRDAQRMASGGVDADLELLHVALVRARTDERAAILARHYPDLAATVTHYGTLLSVRYVPAQFGAIYDQTTRQSGVLRLAEAKWVALVATADGTREMDPTTLRVMWPMAGGDPIGGTVDQDKRAREDAARREGR